MANDGISIKTKIVIFKLNHQSNRTKIIQERQTQFRKAAKVLSPITSKLKSRSKVFIEPEPK